MSSKLLDDLKLTDHKSPDFHRLGASLTDFDPEPGGLLLRELPENRRVVYLCAHHAAALHHPAQIPGP
ncbi:hypothetical protein [Catenulispora rubra]|uniref:hypothetical protein n=1 Tax=Catenulispora rubra TaxID=280293 RepID=UPI0018926817|nr:hypothetical protein [Catenulispora rubra]